jgi:hypothetical protein
MVCVIEHCSEGFVLLLNGSKYPQIDVVVFLCTPDDFDGEKSL